MRKLWVFNATFNNISVLSWWSVLLAEDTKVPGENPRCITRHSIFFYVKSISDNPNIMKRKFKM
jgi:hypothetical protein